MQQDPAPSTGRLWWLVAVLLASGGALAWQGLATLGSKGPAVGSLPRGGDLLVARPYPVDDWVAGATGMIGLKFTVEGPGLGDEFWLRFTEGAGRATARARVYWTNDQDLPVGVPFEKPFKDDC